MNRLKTIGILAIVALTMLAYVGHSQFSNAKDPDYAQDVEVGDTIVLNLGQYLGELVQWQRSADNEFWSNIPGENADSLVFVASAPMSIYLRARIVAGSCDPFHSNVTLLNAIYRPTVTTVNIAGITNNTATIAGNATSNGGGTITQRGICWSINPNPTIENEHVASGSGLGTFSGIATNLNYATTYYARAYATNSVGTAYGNQLEFTTLPIVATLTLDEISDITISSATAAGAISESGGAAITAKGFVWSTTQNPTTTTNMGLTTNGAGMDNFSATLGNLMPGTTYYVRAYATNSAGTAYSNQQSFTTLAWYATVTTADVTNITAFAANGGGNVLSTGGATVTARGVCWATAPEPTLANDHTTNGTGAGTFTSSLTGLMPATLYYVRSYATNSVGTAYGNPVEFTTQPTTPTLTTAEVSAINTNSATCGGNITISGGADVTERGIVWSTSQNPTITTNQGITVDGNGLGSFTSLLTNLLSGTTYYVRAYATNSAGTNYGNQQSFTTLATIPTVTTNTVSSITAFTAVCGGNVTNSGGHAVSARGVCWSVTENPTISNSLTSNGVGTGSYTSNITSLLPNTTYYVRAYATNSLGTAYGEQRTFTTTATTPTVTTQTISQITTNSAVSGGNVTGNGGTTVTARGVCWSTSQNPTISNSHSVDGNGVGSFTSNLTNLAVATTYYVRAYATNNMGTSYGEQRSFSTLQFATVTTNTVNQISSNSAVSGGNVTNNGGTTVVARGVCWHTTQNPTLTNSLGTTSDAAGLGTYTSYITGLNSNTTYYVRAYATNSAGTSYGSQRTFTTLSPNQITDIDGNVYNTVTIGEQIWMRENLKTTQFSNGVDIPNVTDNTAWSSLTSYSYSSYDNSSANISTYGLLYNSYAVFSDNELCPYGWRIPKFDDYYELTDFLGGSSVAGGKLKSQGTTYWNAPNEGATNSSGFTGLPGGWRNGLDGSFSGKGTNGCTALRSINGNYLHLNLSLSYLYAYSVTGQESSYDKEGYSVRCIQGIETNYLPRITSLDATSITNYSASIYGSIDYASGIVSERGIYWGTSPNPLQTGTQLIVEGDYYTSFNVSIATLMDNTTYYVIAYAVNTNGIGYSDEISFTTLISTGTINDVDGNTYNVKSIGTQVWMTENLRTSKYRNGDAIPNIQNATEWENLSTGAWVHYENNTTNETLYGKLYNWHAVNDARGLCPEGWHVPTETEYNGIGNTSDGNVTGGIMKSTRTSPDPHPRWDSPNNGATNESGFNGLPGGERGHNTGSIFSALGTVGYFWTQTSFVPDPERAWYYYLLNYTAEIRKNDVSKQRGLSVRCVKDTPNTKPTLSTTEIILITDTSAISGGHSILSGSSTITAKGIVWGTLENPTLQLNTGISNNGAGDSDFVSELFDLSPGTTYYVKAYATSSEGTGYGVQRTFTTVQTVTNPITGRIWMDRNLGASQVATSNTDTDSYGDLFQWGRGNDGHQLRTSGTTPTTSNSDTPGHSNFILISSDWRNPQNDNLWQGINGTNNPCPIGFRLPNELEWEAERASWNSNNATGAFSSTLKLPLAGYREGSTGSIVNVGPSGQYWSSSVSSPGSRFLFFYGSGAELRGNDRAHGFSVRCIKD